MKRKVSKKSKRRLMIFGILSVVAIGYFFVFFIGYTYNYISLKNEEANLKNQLVSLQDKKANLKIEIQKLNDHEYVVRYAKENYLYSEDGEIVLKIENNTPVVNNVQNNNNYYLIIRIGILIFLVIIIKIRKKEKK